MVFFSHYPFYSKFTQIHSNFTQIPHKSVQPSAHILLFPSKLTDLGRYVFRLHNPCKIAPKNMCYSKLLKFTQIYPNLLKFAHREATGGTTHPNVVKSRTTHCTRYNVRFPTQNWDEIQTTKRWYLITPIFYSKLLKFSGPRGVQPP